MIENYHNSKFFIQNASQIISNITKKIRNYKSGQPLVENIYYNKFQGKQIEIVSEVANLPNRDSVEKKNKFSNSKEFLSTLEYFFNKKTLLINESVDFENLKSWLDEHYTNSYNSQNAHKNFANMSFLDEANKRFLQNILRPFDELCTESKISNENKELFIEFIVNAYLNSLIVHAPMNRKYELNGHRKYIFHCLDVAEAAVKRLIPKRDEGNKDQKISTSDLKDIAIHISVELLHDLIEDYHKALKLDSKGIIKSNVNFLDFFFKFSMIGNNNTFNINSNLDLLEITSLALFLIYLRSEPRSIFQSSNEKKKSKEDIHGMSFRFVDVFDPEYYKHEIKEISSDELEMYRTKLFGNIKLLVDDFIEGIAKLIKNKNSNIDELINKLYDVNKIAKLRYETILGKLDDNIDNLHSLYVYYFAYVYLHYLISINIKNKDNGLNFTKSQIRRGVSRFLNIYYLNDNIKESILKSSSNYYTSLHNYLDEVLSKERLNQLSEEITNAVIAIVGAKDKLDISELSENAKKFSEKASFLFKKYFNYFDEVGKKLNEDYLLKILEIAYLERTKNRIELLIFNRENMLNPNFSIVRDLELWREKVVIIDNDRKNMIIDFHKIVQENMNSYDIVIWKNGEIEIEIPYWIVAKMNGENVVLSKLSNVIHETFGNVSFIKTESLNPRGLNNPLIIAINENIDDYNKIHRLKERLEEEFFISQLK